MLPTQTTVYPNWSCAEDTDALQIARAFQRAIYHRIALPILSCYITFWLVQQHHIAATAPWTATEQQSTGAPLYARLETALVVFEFLYSLLLRKMNVRKQRNGSSIFECCFFRRYPRPLSYLPSYQTAGQTLLSHDRPTHAGALHILTICAIFIHFKISCARLWFYAWLSFG